MRSAAALRNPDLPALTKLYYSLTTAVSQARLHHQTYSFFFSSLFFFLSQMDLHLLRNPGEKEVDLLAGESSSQRPVPREKMISVFLSFQLIVFTEGYITLESLEP